MKNKHIIMLLLFSSIIFWWQAAFGQDNQQTRNNSDFKPSDRVEQILDGIEKRYSAPGFSAHFIQESTLKAMNITDTAQGTVKVKRPGMMIWEYQSPDPQTIITDGEKLWIYRPEDNQVMVGKAPAFFKDGKGAGFLSDMKLLRNKFSVFLDTSETSESRTYHLKLIPQDSSMDVSVIYLVVDQDSYKIKNIVTYNMYGDETQIQMTDYDFDAGFDDNTFDFIIPDGSDILEIE